MDYQRKLEIRRSLEKSSITVGDGGRLKIALVFPARYRIGMSNLGFQLVYAAFNNISGVHCHRVFLPDPEDMPMFISHHQVIRSFETNEPIGEYDVVAFCLNFENDLPGALQILQFGKIPLRSSDRSSSHPLIIGGGVIATINPEPVAAFFDAFILGEGEEIIPELVDVLIATYSHNRDRFCAIQALAEIPGVYIPEYFDPEYDSFGNFTGLRYIGPGATVRLYRRVIPQLDDYPGSTVIHTSECEFPDLHVVELSRSCPRNCMFCLIPSCYGKFRIRSSKSILAESKKAPNGYRIGLLGAGAADHPDLLSVCKQIKENGLQFSFSSLHATGIREDLIHLIEASGSKTYTFAPETGLDNRRRKIRKSILNAELFEAVRTLSEYDVKNIKLYFMIGLPGEKHCDLQSIFQISKQINHILKSCQSGTLRHTRLNVGISCFVPKAQSPFERAPMQKESLLNGALKELKQMFRKSSELRLTHDVPKWAAVQGLLARGDRRTSQMLLDSVVYNKSWRMIFRSSATNPGYFIYRKWRLKDSLPWDHLKTDFYHR